MWGQWWTYAQNMVSYDPDSLGVYELGDENKTTVYYGSGYIKTRLSDHLNKKECPLARHYRFKLFRLKQSAEQENYSFWKIIEELMASFQCITKNWLVA